MSNGSSSSASSSTRGGIGIAGLLTIIFVVLKLNPGGHLTTGIVDWPWFEWWGVSVFCPLIWSAYVGLALVGVIIVFAVLAGVISAASGSR